MLHPSILRLKNGAFRSFRSGHLVLATASVVLFTSNIEGHRCANDKYLREYSGSKRPETNSSALTSSQSYSILKGLSYCRPHSRLCACEDSSPGLQSTQTYKALSRFKLLLYKSKLLPYSYLPVPRLLKPSDPVFNYPEFKRGLKQRQKDEVRLNKLLSSKELKEACETQNQKQLHSILDQMHTLLYGEGVTPQVREDFLIQNGCSGYTPEILEYLVELGKGRGFVEVGAGNGQWARALTDCHVGYCERNANKSSQKDSKQWEFVMAYDNMAALPLPPDIYHSKTIPAHRYFYPNIRKCDSHMDVVRGYVSRGRILLLVFPPPDSMAIETITAYAEAHKENDTVVFVGEGKGGANGNAEMFDYFLGKQSAADGQRGSGGKWVLLKVMNVNICPGGKGYEKMFVFRRVT